MCCISPVAFDAGLALFGLFLCLFLRTPCRSRLDRDCFRILCPESDEAGHLEHVLPEEIILDVALVRMGAGELRPAIAQRAVAAAVAASGASYGWFRFFHFTVSFPGSLFRFFMWHLTKMWKLPPGVSALSHPSAAWLLSVAGTIHYGIPFLYCIRGRSRWTPDTGTHEAGGFRHRSARHPACQRCHGTSDTIRMGEASSLLFKPLPIGKRYLIQLAKNSKWSYHWNGGSFRGSS